MKVYRTVDGKLVRGVEVSQSRKFVKSSGYLADPTDLAYEACEYFKGKKPSKIAVAHWLADKFGYERGKPTDTDFVDTLDSLMMEYPYAYDEYHKDTPDDEYVDFYEAEEEVLQSKKFVKSSVENAIRELSEYFQRTPDGDTIYPRYKITRDDEIEIGNICYENDVDFAMGEYSVTVYPKDEDDEDEDIYSGCHGKFDKRRREKKEDELESSRRRIKSSASLPITELDVEIGRNDKGDVVYKNTKFGTYRLLKADGRLEEVSMDGGRAESVLDKWSRSYGIEYDGKLNSSVSRNAITFSKFNRISSLFIKNDRLVEGEECVIQIKDKNGRWEDVSYDREKPYWSIKGKPKMFSDEKTARKSALMKALNDAGYSEEAGNLQISMS